MQFPSGDGMPQGAELLVCSADKVLGCSTSRRRCTVLLFWLTLHTSSLTPAVCGPTVTITLRSNSGLCLDASGGKSENGTPLDIWQCNGHPNQAWFFDGGSYTIRSAANPSKCVDAGLLKGGNQIMLWDCNGHPQQKFGYDGNLGTIYLAASNADASLCMDASKKPKAGNKVLTWQCNKQTQQAFNVISYAPQTISMRGNSNLCLDLTGGNTANGSPIDMWECNGFTNQAWLFTPGSFEVRYAADPSKCIDAGTNFKTGTKLMIWDCNGNKQQTWGYDAKAGTIYLVSSESDASLCIDAFSPQMPGHAIQVWHCNAAPQQQFNILNGISIRSKYNDNMCLDLAGGKIQNGSPVQLWPCNGLANQMWIVSGMQIVYGLDTSKCLDAGNSKAGTRLQLWDCNGQSQQLFGYDGKFVFLTRSEADASKCVDIAGGSFTAGTPVQIWECSGCWNQQWIIGASVAAEGLQSTAASAADHTRNKSLGALHYKDMFSIGNCPPLPGPAPAPAPCVGCGCVLTDQEKHIADYVSQRKLRYPDEIRKQIQSGATTADSLSADMYRWWVQLAFADQSTAIADFVNLMTNAQQKAAKADWVAVAMGWLSVIGGAVGAVLAGPEFLALSAAAATEFTRATGFVNNALNTFKAAAQKSAGSDFLVAANNFRSQLPNSQTKQLNSVDSFINGIKNIGGNDKVQALVVAYAVVTAIIEGTISYRKAFNQYYVAYLKSAGVDNQATYFSYSNVKHRPNIVWPSTPKGLDSCTVATSVYDLNKYCVSKYTPGFENLWHGVQITNYWLNGAESLHLDCSNLDAKAYIGCWVRQDYYKRGSPACDDAYKKVMSDACSLRGPNCWTQQAEGFCKNWITSAASFFACNSGDRTGCWHRSDLKTCPGIRSTLNSTAMVFV